VNFPQFVIPAKAGTQQALGVQRDFQPTVYLLASRKNGAIYTGVTSDLIKRVHEHCEGVVAGFTKEYGVKRLVGFLLSRG
jgi:putative endonuclease